MIIKDFKEVHDVLSHNVPPNRSFKGVYNLDTITRLLHFLGDPQNTYKVIHVAGTSGKTSTAYYIAALLHAAGYKTGLSVSPHVDEVNERVQLQLVPLAEKEFCKELGIFIDEVKKSSTQPTYFELLVAFAFWEFARQQVDYAVIEVGLGGLLDGTNVISIPDKVCVITDIGLDHTRVLGKTLPEIAAQKAGIIKPGNRVFSLKQPEEVIAVFRESAKQSHVKLTLFEQTDSPAAQDLPAFQKRNWSLACQVYDTLVQERDLPQLDEEQLHMAASVHIPARMETIMVGQHVLILDGAHNDQKLRALVKSIQQKYPNEQAGVLFSLKDGKELDLNAVLNELKPITAELIVTGFGVQQDLPSHAIEPEIVAEAASKLGFKNVATIDDPLEAFGRLQQTASKLWLVAGSFYLLNQIRPRILKR